jgi:type I restriction enzyme R subunit
MSLSVRIKQQFNNLRLMRGMEDAPSGYRTLYYGVADILQGAHFSSKQQVFLAFVLSHYVSVGVEELDQNKLTPLLRLKYHDSIADAVADLGNPDEIGRVFAGFQKYLYRREIAA